MSINRKTLLLCALMVLGWVFIYVGHYNSATPLGVLVAIGTWILVGLFVYDRYRTQKEWERKYAQR